MSIDKDFHYLFIDIHKYIRGRLWCGDKMMMWSDVWISDCTNGFKWIRVKKRLTQTKNGGNQEMN